MTAQLWSTGPAFFYVGLGAGRAPVFLGTCREPPEIVPIDPAIVPVPNDWKGAAKGFDWQYLGCSALCSCLMGRYDEGVMAQLESTPNPFGTRGLNLFGDMGAFLLQEGLTFPTWVVFPYSPANTSGKPSMTGMVPGYHFFAGYVAHLGRRVGTRDLVVPIAFQFEQAFSAVTGSFTLYDGNLIGLPPVT